MPLNPVIKELVKNFRGQAEAYLSPSYNETQLRRDFLDKVIKALGWDVDNEQASSETFREVVHEDRLSVDGQSKAPDYCVQLGGRKLFYIEAKKPAVNISADAAPAYQVRRYGWTAKMPVCLLSGFAEFAVYDTSIKPSPKDDAAAARIFTAALVEEMFALKEREAAEVLPQARTVVQRQIAALDRRIDAGVYGLYGLTSDEIAIVEGKTGEN